MILLSIESIDAQDSSIMMPLQCLLTEGAMKARTMMYLDAGHLRALKSEARLRRISLVEPLRKAVQIPHPAFSIRSASRLLPGAGCPLLPSMELLSY